MEGTAGTVAATDMVHTLRTLDMLRMVLLPTQASAIMQTADITQGMHIVERAPIMGGVHIVAATLITRVVTTIGDSATTVTAGHIMATMAMPHHIMLAITPLAGGVTIHTMGGIAAVIRTATMDLIPPGTSLLSD